MKMTITRHWPQDTAFDGSAIPAKDDHYTFDPSGWQSVAEMQKELMRRFSHRNAVKIENGIQYQETFFKQDVTLRD